MAKKTEETKVTGTVVNEDNILDSIKNGNKMPEGLAKEVMDNIAKEERDKKSSELKQTILKASYWNKKELLQLRSRRREENITKEALSRSKEALDKLCGGEITPTEYNKLLDESNTTKRKAVVDSNNVFKEELAELKNSLAGNYVWDWDRC